MPEISHTARATAGTLMDIEAILFRPEDPEAWSTAHGGKISGKTGAETAAGG